jgi:transposase
MSESNTHDKDLVALIGIDWADKKHDVAILDIATGQRSQLQIEHKPEALIAWVRTLQEHYGDGPIGVCLEQSRGPLIYSLMQHGMFRLYPINPKAFKNFRKALRPSGAKSDKSDAKLLLEYLDKHREFLKAWIPDDVQTRLLGLLVEDRLVMVRDRTRLANRLTAVLKGYFPQALDWAGEMIFTPLACRFLTKWPRLESVQRADEKTIRAFYYAHKSRRADLIERRIQQIKSAIPLSTDEAILEASIRRVQAIVPQIQQLNTAIAEYDKRIQDLFVQRKDALLFRELPGAGKQLAPRLLVAFGTQKDRFESVVELQSYSGIAPVTEQTGQPDPWIHWRLACPKFLRQTFHEFAAGSRRRSLWANAYYEQQRAIGKNHHAAIRQLAYKWIRILYRCWIDNVPYDEQRYLKALERRGSPLVKLIQAAA